MDGEKERRPLKRNGDSFAFALGPNISFLSKFQFISSFGFRLDCCHVYFETFLIRCGLLPRTDYSFDPSSFSGRVEG